MSEPEKFLERWSRRKHEADDESSAPEKGLDVEAPAQPVADEKKASVQASENDDPPFDLSTLPSLESIGAKSDVRAFMQAGVPPEVKHAALRRAWSADPDIRDFIGLVENGWDFNDPHGVPGFGPMPEGVDVSLLLAQAIGAAAPQVFTTEPDELSPPAELHHGPEQIPAVPETGKPGNDLPLAAEEVVETEILHRGANHIALQESFDSRPPTRGSRHGGALPK
jgi:hypothetical protein